MGRPKPARRHWRFESIIITTAAKAVKMAKYRIGDMIVLVG